MRWSREVPAAHADAARMPWCVARATLCCSIAAGGSRRDDRQGSMVGPRPPGVPVGWFCANIHLLAAHMEQGRERGGPSAPQRNIPDGPRVRLCVFEGCCYPVAFALPPLPPLGQQAPPPAGGVSGEPGAEGTCAERMKRPPPPNEVGRASIPKAQGPLGQWLPIS